MKELLTKLGLASTSSVVLTEAFTLDNLWSALLSLGISILTVLAVDGIQLLKSWIKSKQRKIDEESKED